MAFSADDRSTVNAELDEDSEDNGELLQELDVLREIYINELEINFDLFGKVESIAAQLHPSTGENIDQKWVCLVLHITPSRDYPHSLPEISICGPRGIADEHVASMKKRLYQIAQDKKGSPMIYELIEFAKESLTQINVPYGCCMICLEEFDSCQQNFTKTDCYHYFHCSCLASYVDHCKALLESSAEDSSTFLQKSTPDSQIVCPVCREALPSDLDLSALNLAKVVNTFEEKYVPSAEMHEWQQKMSKLYEKQKQNGGIIDLEEEKNKYLMPKDFVVDVSQKHQNEETLSQHHSETSRATSKTNRMSKHKKNSGAQENRGRRKFDGGKEFAYRSKDEQREKQKYKKENTNDFKREVTTTFDKEIDQVLNSGHDIKQNTNTFDPVSQVSDQKSLTELQNSEIIGETLERENKMEDNRNHVDIKTSGDYATSPDEKGNFERSNSDCREGSKNKHAMRSDHEKKADCHRIHDRHKNAKDVDNSSGKNLPESNHESCQLDNQLCSEEFSKNENEPQAVSTQDSKNQRDLRKHLGQKVCHRNFNYSEQSETRKMNDYRYNNSTRKAKPDNYTGMTWKNRNYGHYKNHPRNQFAEQNSCNGSQMNFFQKEHKDEHSDKIDPATGEVPSDRRPSTSDTKASKSCPKPTLSNEHSDCVDGQSFQHEKPSATENHITDRSRNCFDQRIPSSLDTDFCDNKNQTKNTKSVSCHKMCEDEDQNKATVSSNNPASADKQGTEESNRKSKFHSYRHSASKNQRDLHTWGEQNGQNTSRSAASRNSDRTFNDGFSEPHFEFRKRNSRATGAKNVRYSTAPNKPQTRDTAAIASTVPRQT